MRHIHVIVSVLGTRFLTARNVFKIIFLSFLRFCLNISTAALCYHAYALGAKGPQLTLWTFN